MTMSIDRIQTAINDLNNGRMVILTDNPDRENEGDLIAPAETITAEQMNFMIRNGTGIVCLGLTEERLRDLHLPLMVPVSANTSFRNTPFTVSIDAKNGISTGVSAEDRVVTVHAAIADNSSADDLVIPGHIFPLQANPHGVLGRQGHTEGSVDLVRLAGFKPAAVLCEIMNPDGTMAKGLQLNAFAKAHGLTILSIDDIINYRLAHENTIESEASSTLPLDHYGTFSITAIKEKLTGAEHLIIKKPCKDNTQPTLVRIHSSCITGDLFGSKRCDCHSQLHYSLKKISEEGGILIYLQQEGRGIGLFNKVKAYGLQEKGYDTVEANLELGLPVDAREYYIAANYLRNCSINAIRLLTNNPVKIDSLKRCGIQTVERVAIPSFENEHNHQYLKTKVSKLNHQIHLEQLIDLKRVSS